MIDTAIRDLTAAAYTIDTDTPEADGTLAWNSTTLVLVQVRAGDHVGTGWTYAPPAATAFITGTLTDLVVGCDPFDISGIADRMGKAVRNAGRPGIAGCAISAIDVALWDLKARLLQLPLHHLLGAVRDRVPVYGSGGFTTYSADQLTAQLEHWVDQ